MQKKQNPHHYNIEQNQTSTNLSFTSQKNKQTQKIAISPELARKIRLLSMMVISIYEKRIKNGFKNIKCKPLRILQIKSRFIEVFYKLVRNSEYDRKFQAIQTIKRYYIKKRNQNLQIIAAILIQSKMAAMRVINVVFYSKQKNNLATAFQRLSKLCKSKRMLLNLNYRIGFRKLESIKNLVLRRYFYRVRNSRYLIQCRLKLQNIIKVIKQTRLRSIKIGLDKLRRNLYKTRRQQICSQIRMIDSRIQMENDGQLKQLKQKQYLMKKNLMQIQKQKQLIGEAYQLEVKEAQTKNIQIQQKIKQIKQQNQSLVNQIKNIQSKLKVQYSLNQIFSMFYNNFLLYIIKNKNKRLVKSQILQALTKPLVPINIPIDNLKQQNKVMRQLINQYVLIYGHKSIQNKQLQAPYEYLVLQNQTMYRMLLSLLPRLAYNKKELTQLKQNLDIVQSVLKEFKR